LERAPELDPDDVVAGVGAEAPGRHRALHRLRPRKRARRHHYRRGLALRDLQREGGAGEDGYGMAGSLLRRDLAHAPQRAELEALGGGDESRDRAEVWAQGTKGPAKELGGHGYDRDLRVPGRLREIAGRVQCGQGDPGEISRALMPVTDLVRLRGITGPQGHHVAATREVGGQRGSPRAGADH